MLKLDADLPEGALLGAETRHLGKLVAAAGGLWFPPDGLEAETGSPVSRWQEASGADAMPADPNQGHGLAAPGGGLSLRSGVNCGFARERALGDSAEFTLAVLFRPGTEDSRTLATVNLRDQKNYLFLTHQEGRIAFKSQAETGECALPVPRGDAPLLVLAGFSAGRMYLRLGDDSVVSQSEPDLSVTGPADLFLGCRSHRPGLVKTLGEGQLLSVWLWPRNLLDPGLTGAAADSAAAGLAALGDWIFWGS